MRKVNPKKSLGQHFLKDVSIAQQIVDSLQEQQGGNVLEIGPGTGVLTSLLLIKPINLKAIDVDYDSIEFLKTKYPESLDKFIHGDFLRTDPDSLFPSAFSIIGNFPYNISSQIFFKVLENKDTVTEVVCMLQREVANRIIAPPGSRTYGILSVLLQGYYIGEKVTDVPPEVFDPPPKVWSTVIRLKRNNIMALNCDEKLFKSVVKMSFQMRRKTLRNALKGLNLPASKTEMELFDKRAEQLSVDDFVALTNLVTNSIK